MSRSRLKPDHMEPGLFVLLLKLSNDTLIEDFPYVQWLRDNRERITNRLMRAPLDPDYDVVRIRRMYQRYMRRFRQNVSA